MGKKVAPVEKKEVKQENYPDYGDFMKAKKEKELKTVNQKG